MPWLIAAALLTSLVLGAAFIVVHRTNDLRGEAVEAPRDPLTDEQTMMQVVDSAAEFIRAGKLGTPNASYLLQSCSADGGPPYQGSAYVNFDMPSITETPAFLRRVAAAMARHGWREGLRPNDHPGGKILARSGISGLIYRNPDVDGRGVLQIYGECRNVTDHTEDQVSFVDITDRLR